MSNATADQLRLLANHHAFTAAHRARVVHQRGATRWESESPYFCCLLLESTDGLDQVRPDTRAVRTFPWSAAATPELERMGFRPAGCLRYMFASTETGSSRPGATPLTIDCASDERGLVDFSTVQTDAFVEPGEDRGELFAFLHGANLRNLFAPAQRFYVGRDRGSPVAVTLALDDDRTVGIYAVATMPARRRRGFSRALLSRALADAARADKPTATLQVHRDSAAEQLYVHLGFQTSFDALLWSR